MPPETNKRDVTIETLLKYATERCTEDNITPPCRGDVIQHLGQHDDELYSRGSLKKFFISYRNRFIEEQRERDKKTQSKPFGRF